LNGEWDYSLNSGIVKPKYKRKIIVPFPIESPLSGVKKKILQPGMKLWYRKIVDLTKIKNNGRFLLHFGAVDQFTEVFINKNKVGDHDGGYTSFYFDITNYINKNLDKTEIVVKVKDNYSKDGAAFGKQGKPRTHTFYAQTGGIWQTVWIESVPRTYIKNVKITPRYDKPSVSFLMTIEGKKIQNNKGMLKF
jgi:beta-galactosidase/beta-glucuronidase